MNDDLTKRMEQIQAMQHALVEQLVESGVVDSAEFKGTIEKWQKKMGIQSVEDPLLFLTKKTAEMPGVNPKNSFDSIDVASKKILLVDNVKFIRELIKNTLVSRGFTTFFEGEDGLEAVELFKANQPDIVLMDIEMKHMNGIEALQEIRKFDQKTPVIIMTGNPTQDYVKKAVAYGMTDFVAKPLDVNRVLDVIARLLQQG